MERGSKLSLVLKMEYNFFPMLKEHCFLYFPSLDNLALSRVSVTNQCLWLSNLYLKLLLLSSRHSYKRHFILAGPKLNLFFLPFLYVLPQNMVYLATQQNSPLFLIFPPLYPVTTFPGVHFLNHFHALRFFLFCYLHFHKQSCCPAISKEEHTYTWWYSTKVREDIWECLFSFIFCILLNFYVNVITDTLHKYVNTFYKICISRECMLNFLLIEFHN